MTPTPSPRIFRVLLAAVAIFASLWLLTTALWLRGRAQPTTIGDLDSATRQELVADLIEQSPGVFQSSWFAPSVGYTLRPNADLEAWGSRFRSNALGYRTHPPEKPADVYRVVFLGDSWTFGMGVEQEQSYPEVFARLANEQQVAQQQGKRTVQAWILALPGYNTFNFTSAFWHHFDQLQPDAVVVGISANDNHSTHAILPNGSASKSVVQPDQFGDRHPVIYPARSIDSYRYAERWRISFALLRDLEERLQHLGVPLNHFFVGRTRELDMQARVAQAGLRAPFVVVPLDRTKGEYSNRRWGHGTPEANELYAAYVYSDLAQTLDWPPLSNPPAAYQRHVPPVRPPGTPGSLSDTEAAAAWWELYSAQAAHSSREFFPPSFAPGRKARLQALGDFAARSGLLGRSATLLIGRPEGPAAASKTMRLKYRALADAPELYPIDLVVNVPAAGQGTTLTQSIKSGGSGWIEVRLPPSSYSVIDLQLDSSRTAGPNESRPAASLWIDEIRFASPTTSPTKDESSRGVD